MSDDAEDDSSEDLTPSEYRAQINLAQFDLEAKRTALRVLEYAAELDDFRDSSVVCDEQAAALEDAVGAVETAANAIWPGDDTDIPDLDGYIEDSDAIVTDDSDE